MIANALHLRFGKGVSTSGPRLADFHEAPDRVHQRDHGAMAMIAGHGVVQRLPQALNHADPRVIDGLKEQLELGVVRQPLPVCLTSTVIVVALLHGEMLPNFVRFRAPAICVQRATTKPRRTYPRLVPGAASLTLWRSGGQGVDKSGPEAVGNAAHGSASWTRRESVFPHFGLPWYRESPGQSVRLRSGQ